jgi:2-phospho-L-lactate guanylyltransferase
VVPVKRLEAAKTRLSGVAGAHRRDLALAFALDTVAAALRCRLVAGVVVVTDDPQGGRRLGELGARVVADVPDAGLNPALLHGAAAATATHPDAGVGALSADLPGLRPDELGRALERAARSRSAFVRDAQGAGTTMLLARRYEDFVPAFGAGSAAAHLSSGAVELTGSDLASLRRDIDTAADLEAGLALGLGPETTRVARRLPLLAQS